jgi:RimJ/RimL family protein N-acetyltransferase
VHEQSAASAAHFQAQLDERGFGFWAVEVHFTREFIGFTGLDQVDEGMPFTGIEIGWRLAAEDFDDPTEPEGPLRRNVPYRNRQ